MLKTDSDVFFDDIIKSFMSEYNNIIRQTGESGFNFKYGVAEMVNI